MAMTNGNGATDGLEASIALDARQREHSVQHDDYARGEGVFHFMFPATWGEYGRNLATLPDSPPAYNRTAFWTSRDISLLSTPKYEAMWASAVGIAVTKAAAWGWEVESSVPLRRKRAHQVLLNSTAGVFTGWVHFLSAHLRSFILTGKAIVEIERETKAYGSRIRALHHLDPLRCRITDDPLIPVEYMDRKGKIHELRYWQVMLFADNLDPTEGEYGLVESSAERAYERIKLMAGISRYLYEKVTGKRVLAIEFIPGLSPKQLENALQGAEENRAAKGNMIYMGTMLVPLPTDTPVQRVTIPLAEVPDGFEPQQLRDDATVIYAGATGQDVNDLDPRLASRQTLGSGAQSFILNEKSKGKGLAAWRKQWEHNMNTAVLDDTATTFAWAESSLDDEERKAKIEEIRTNTNKTRVESQFISPEQARNLLADAGDLPKEFLDEDITAGGTIEDDEKNPEKGDVEDESTQAPGKADEADEDEPVEESDTQKERSRPLDVARLLLQEREAAARLAGELGVTAETVKHLGGQHNQKRHAWRFAGNEQTSTNARRSMTATPQKGEREEYKKRARAKLGLPERPVREPGKRDEAAAVQPKKRGDVVKERLETAHQKVADSVGVKREAFEKAGAKLKEIQEESRLLGERAMQLAKEGKDDTAVLGKIQQKGKEAVQQMAIVRKAADEYNAVKEKTFKEYADALRVDNPTSLNATYIGIGKARKAQFEEAADMVAGMVSRDVMPPDMPVNINGRSGNRANYNYWRQEVNIKAGGPRTLAHELGHHIESNSPGLFGRAREFLYGRTAGEREVSLRSVTKQSYGRDEYTRKDKWIHPYMGKVYGDATELISMGIEYLLTEPMTLLRDDPEYFYFLIDVLQGG